MRPSELVRVYFGQAVLGAGFGDGRTFQVRPFSLYDVFL